MLCINAVRWLGSRLHTAAVKIPAKGEWMCVPPASQQLQKKGWIERVNSLGIDVGKKKCRAALKDERGDIIREFFFLSRSASLAASSLSVFILAVLSWLDGVTVRQAFVYVILHRRRFG
ncbi:MAG TPA: hypothetical protein VEH06_08425 [Candidatus Bathyarchaeia archaeon]|nr:hypothetical protein [Candidatus Bathyarchaeia archaeon]